MIAGHWAPAKKHLEYRLEPTSLRARNRPETTVPRSLERPELRFRGLAAQASETRAGTAKPETATAGSDGKRDRQIQTEKFHRFCALNECRAL